MIVTIIAPASTIEFDATLSESHPATATVTEHPVEVGSNVTDHVRPDIDRVQFEVMVTNAPIRAPGSNLDGAQGLVQGLDLQVPTTTSLPIEIPGVGAALRGAGALNGTTVVRAQTLQFTSEFDRVGSVYHAVKRLQETSALLTIITSLRRYENFVIASVIPTRTTGEGDCIRFQFEARQIRFVTTQTVVAPATAPAATKKNLGKKTTTAAPPKEALDVKIGKAIGLIK